jgi:hypothetical protein
MPACYDLPAAFAQYPLRGGPNDVAKRLSSSGRKACGLTRFESKATAYPDKYVGVSTDIFIPYPICQPDSLRRSDFAFGRDSLRRRHVKPSW